MLALGGRGPEPGRDGAAWRMADVSVEHLSYEDIAAAVASGVMTLEAGCFRPSRAVTGQEAVDAIQRLERLAARARAREPVDAWESLTLANQLTLLRLAPGAGVRDPRALRAAGVGAGRLRRRPGSPTASTA